MANVLSVAAKDGKKKKPKGKPPLKRDKDGNRQPTKGGLKLKERWHERIKNGEVYLGGVAGGQAGPVGPDGLYPIRWPQPGQITFPGRVVMPDRMTTGGLAPAPNVNLPGVMPGPSINVPGRTAPGPSINLPGMAPGPNVNVPAQNLERNILSANGRRRTRR